MTDSPGSSCLQRTHSGGTTGTTGLCTGPCTGTTGPCTGTTGLCTGPCTGTIGPCTGPCTGTTGPCTGPCTGTIRPCTGLCTGLCTGTTGPCTTVVKVESGEPVLMPSQTAELHFLRSRVRELEREKAELSAENQRLNSMLVHEIPGLLSTMWQTLGQVNGHHSVSTATGRSDSYAPYSHHHPTVANQDGDFSPEVYVQPVQEELSGDVSESWGPLASEDEEVPDLGLGSHMGEEAPLCSQTDMEELRRSCSESQCTAGHVNGQVRQVEVYPGSGVLCDVRSWQAANQAPSPTAMARLLLLGVFDMNTLMNSNLRGGRSRRPAFHPQRSALDPHKINAIFNAILARFPLAKRGIIGSGINSKLSEIRFRSRRANRDPRFL